MRLLPLLAACLLPASAAMAAPADDAARGKDLFTTCAVCHTIAKGQPNKLGPNLNGIVGAKAGTRAAFAYSPAMKAAAIQWNDKTLDAFLTKPQAAVPGNRMPYGGMADPASRRALIAYLKDAGR